MAEQRQAAIVTDEFYVGYLNPVPRGYARRVRAAVMVLALLVVVAAAGIARYQAGAGDAVWEMEPVTMTGLFIAAPYPVLMVEGDGPDSPSRTVILVGAGKCGAFEPSGYCGLLGGSGGPADREQGRRAAMKIFDGKLVQVKGTRLTRDGRMMIELEEGERAVVLIPDDSERLDRLRPELSEGRESTLVGRIVDAKCYLGAMKPGDGKAHRACAVRCISGGIPPMLVEGSGEHHRYYLLAHSGGPLDILPFVGDEVQLSGRVQWQGSDIWLFNLETAGIRRR